MSDIYDPEVKDPQHANPYSHKVPAENLNEESPSTQTPVPDQLGAAEASTTGSAGTQAAATAETEALGQPTPENSNEAQPIPYRNQQRKSFKGKGVASKKSHKKLFLFLGIGGGASIFGILTAAFFIIGLLKIPNFAQHITEFEFARITRTFAQRTEQVTAEKVAIDSADAGLKDKIQATYQNIRGNTWGLLDKYRPQKVIDNLQTNGRLEFNYNSGVLGRQTLNGVTFDGTTYVIDNGGFFGKLHPIQNFRNDVNLAGNFGTALNEGLRDETPLIIRGAVENNLRKELGISLFAWVVGRYQGKTPAEADIQMQQDSFTRLDDQSAAGTTGNAQIDQAQRDGAQAEKNCATDPACIQKTLDSGNIEPQVAVDVVEKDLADGFLKKVSSFASPIVAIGLPVCMIYSGSLQKSGPTIDAQSKEQQRTYFLIASAADQQKAGATSSEAVGAMNWKLGDINKSNPEIRQSGETVDTTLMPSSQTSGGGQFTVFDKFMGPFKGIADTVANVGCPVLTSPTGFVSAAVIGTLLGALSGGSSEGLSGLVDSVVSGLTTQFTTVDGLKDFATKTIRDGGLIAGATLLAKRVVVSGMGATNNGLSMGTTIDNTADAGGNNNAQVVMQRQFYGVPMTNSETAMNDQADQQYRVAKEKSQSVYQRYFAIHNPDSLLTRFGITLSGQVNRSVFSSLFATIGKIFNPLTMIPKVFSSLTAKAALAAGSTDNQHYGIVQWGWTPAEEALINSNASYQPLENAKVFTDLAGAYGSGDLEKKLQDTYGECFTASMGKLLSEEKIVRYSNGDVNPNEGLCSESQLGSSNNSYGFQAVFRWRLMNSYNATTQQLTDVQNANGAS